MAKPADGADDALRAAVFDGRKPARHRRSLGVQASEAIRRGMRESHEREFRFCFTCGQVTAHYKVPHPNPDRPDGQWPSRLVPPLVREDGRVVAEIFVRVTRTWCEGHQGSRPVRVETPVLPLSEDLLERAAIMEHCGGMDRAAAERAALRDAGAFDFRRGSPLRGPTCPSGGAPA